MRLLGLDPGLRATGWGIIDAADGGLRHVAHGVIIGDPASPMASRLAALFDAVRSVLKTHRPEAAAVEAVFVNRNGQSTLKLGQARGVVMLAPALSGIEVAEYASTMVKQAVVGTGHASKAQVAMMVRTLLPLARVEEGDAADALAVAICHAHRDRTAARWGLGRSAASAEISMPSSAGPGRAGASVPSRAFSRAGRGRA